VTQVEPELSAIELMLATNYQPFTQEGWIFEFKWDGYRVLASKNQLLTRNKKNATKRYPELMEPLAALRGSFILDGEVCLLDEKGLPRFEDMRARILRKRGGDAVNYFAFDLLFHNGRDLRALPLIERKAKLRKLIPRDHPRLTFVDHIETEGEFLFKHAVQIGMEGVMGKRANSPYIAGRTLEWRKAKRAGHHDGWERPLNRSG